jgi:rhodanese-related sulfurtransferase
MTFNGKPIMRVGFFAALICIAGGLTGIGTNFGLVFNYEAIAAAKEDQARTEKTFMINLEQSKALFDSGKAIFVDARDPAECDAGHIKGAINLPWEEFGMKYPEVSKALPMDSLLVTYCAGADCEMSVNLGRKLRSIGYKDVRVFEGGWQLWVKAGYPVEKKK